MKTTLFTAVLFLTLLASVAWSGEYTYIKPTKLISEKTGWVMLGADIKPTDPPPPRTCSYFMRHFRFNTNTTGGKNMLNVLLEAMSTNKKIDIWYERATGYTECEADELSIVNSIGFR